MLYVLKKTFQTFWHLCPLQLDDTVWHDDGDTNNEWRQRRTHVRDFSPDTKLRKVLVVFSPASASGSRWPRCRTSRQMRRPDACLTMLLCSEFLHLYYLISSLILFFLSNNRCTCCETGSHVGEDRSGSSLDLQLKRIDLEAIVGPSHSVELYVPFVFGPIR